MGDNYEYEKKTILIVDDEQKIVDLLVHNLKREGYNTIEANDGVTAVEIAKEQRPDLILLDIMLPRLDGLSVCKKIKNIYNVPILMVTAKDDELDKIVGLELGADDYITKPFNIQIAMQRIQAVLRRTMGKKEEHLYRCGNLVIDFETRTVTKSGEKLSLTPTEFKLLYVFVKNENMALTRNLLLEKLWDSEGNFVDEHTLTINISRLRAKIKDAQYKYIKTLYGMGYQWIGAQNE